jgi:GDP-L-fucose synthase
VIFSSHTGYPPFEHPVKEEEYWIAAPHEFYFGYGWMRRYLERIGEFTASKSKTKVAIVRPSAPYGVWDNFDLATCHVIPALIRKAVEKQDPYVVWGSGKEVRDFIYIKDFVKGCLLLLEKNPNADPTNIASGQSVTIKKVVDIILKAADHEDARVVYDASKPTAIPKRMIDNSKARKELGFELDYTLEEGLTETVKWYQKMRKKGYIN